MLSVNSSKDKPRYYKPQQESEENVSVFLQQFLSLAGAKHKTEFFMLRALRTKDCCRSSNKAYHL